MDEETLGRLQILLDYDWDRQPLLSLVVLGLPELRDRLELQRHRTLYTRICHRLGLETNEQEDTDDYISFRLQVTGLEEEVFARDDVPLIHESSMGMYREIDRIQ